VRANIDIYSNSELPYLEKLVELFLHNPANKQINKQHSENMTQQCRLQWSSGSMPDCSARGPGMESPCGQLCLLLKPM